MLKLWINLKCIFQIICGVEIISFVQDPNQINTLTVRLHIREGEIGTWVFAKKKKGAMERERKNTVTEISYILQEEVCWPTILPTSIELSELPVFVFCILLFVGLSHIEYYCWTVNELLVVLFSLFFFFFESILYFSFENKWNKNSFRFTRVPFIKNCRKVVERTTAYHLCHMHYSTISIRSLEVALLAFRMHFIELALDLVFWYWHWSPSSQIIR